MSEEGVGKKAFCLYIHLFKVDKFIKMQYTHIHKSSQTNWLIKVNHPILQKKKSSNLLIKAKEKEKKVKQVCDVS